MYSSKRVVIIEVVVRDIGEDAAGKLNACNAPLMHGVRAYLHKYITAARRMRIRAKRLCTEIASGVVCVDVSTVSPIWFCTVDIRPQR